MFRKKLNVTEIHRGATIEYTVRGKKNIELEKAKIKKDLETGLCTKVIVGKDSAILWATGLRD